MPSSSSETGFRACEAYLFDTGLQLYPFATRLQLYPTVTFFTQGGRGGINIWICTPSSYPDYKLSVYTTLNLLDAFLVYYPER